MLNRIVHLIKRVYVKFFISEGFGYANYLKKQNSFYALGENCFLSKTIIVSEPYLTSIGNNVWITNGCVLLGHDASVIMTNAAKMQDKSCFGILDKVGPIRIGDNSFIGINSIILPNIKIGSNTIVGTGSVVSKDVADNTVVAGNPARFICSIEDYLEKSEQINKSYPWRHLLEQRRNIPPYVSNKATELLEKKLEKKRIKHFFSD